MQWIIGLAGLNLILTAVLLYRMFGKKDDEIRQQLTVIEKNQERLQRVLQEEGLRNRQESQHALKEFSESLLSRMADISTLHKNQSDIFSKQLTSLTQMNEQKLERVRGIVEDRLKILQEDNSLKLEKMRETVDEKLHATLEKRLGESFKVVSDRLERVHQGLGEMQTFASGVGDLKKVLSNVKTRGILGEVQLGALLEQIMTPDQYDTNVRTKAGSQDAVEFAIKLPHGDRTVYLPIDAKFPTEDYERLQDAQEQGVLSAIEEAGKALESRRKLEARKIRDKYIDPPQTTDFGILFLPFEGLFSEVLRRPGFCDFLQREFRVTVAGPTTIAAILNSLQMGFRTLAVEKRASDVWSLLGNVKSEFGKFGDILDKTHKKLQQASDSIETAARKSRTIERRLKKVEQMPSESDNEPKIEGPVFDLAGE